MRVWTLEYGLVSIHLITKRREAELSQFSENRIKDEAVLTLAEKVEMVVDERLDQLYPEMWSSIIEVETTDGKNLQKR